MELILTRLPTKCITDVTGNLYFIEPKILINPKSDADICKHETGVYIISNHNQW